MFKKIALLLLLICSAPLHADTPLSFSNVSVRAPIPGVPNTAAFMIIQNASSASVNLVAAQTEVAKRVELHTHVHQDGMMKMREIPAIEVPGQGEVQLKSGGYHIMLFELTQPLKDGDTIQLKLTFDNGQQHDVEAQVKDMMAHHHHH